MCCVAHLSYGSSQAWAVLTHKLARCMQATVPVLWLMPALQLLLLLFFMSVAVSHWIYNWVLLAPCLMTGTTQPYSHHGFAACSTIPPEGQLNVVPKQPTTLSVIWLIATTKLAKTSRVWHHATKASAHISKEAVLLVLLQNWLLNIVSASHGRLSRTARVAPDRWPAK